MTSSQQIKATATCSRFCRSEVGYGKVVFFALGSNQGVHEVAFLPGGFGEEFGGWELPILRVNRMSSPFLYGCPLRTALQSTHAPCHVAPSVFKVRNKEYLWLWTSLTFWISPGGDQSFIGLTWLDEAQGRHREDNFPALRSMDLGPSLYLREPSQQLLG